MQHDFNFKDPSFIELVKQKLAEDNRSDCEYWHNLGRSADEINDMIARLESELHAVLRIEDRAMVNIQQVFAGFNALYQ